MIIYNCCEARGLLIVIVMLIASYILANRSVKGMTNSALASLVGVGFGTFGFSLFGMPLDQVPVFGQVITSSLPGAIVGQSVFFGLLATVCALVGQKVLHYHAFNGRALFKAFTIATFIGMALGLFFIPACLNA